MAYTPNPVDATQPTEDKFVESAAAEFRALKDHVNSEVERLDDDIAALAPGGAISSDAVADLFTCDGVQTVFTLFRDPGRLANLDVSIGGVTQRPIVDYNWVSPGRTLTFVVPPIAGVQNLLVRYTEGLPADTTGTLRSDLSNTTESDLGDALIGVKQPLAGSVARTQHDKNADEFWATDFGAKFDDVTDDTAALIACMTALHTAGGGTMMLPAGTARVTSVVFAWASDSSVNIRGQGKKATYLRKTGASTTPVLDFSAVGVLDIESEFSDFAIIGNPSHHGLRMSNCGRFTLRNIRISFCDVGFENLGSLIFNVYDPDFSSNNIGYRQARLNAVYCNLISFYGGGINLNAVRGVDLNHGDMVRFVGVDFEHNGTGADLTTGMMLIRAETPVAAGVSFVTLEGCWAEANNGMPIIVENAPGLVLVLRDLQEFGAGSGKFMTVAAPNVSLLVMENVNCNDTIVTAAKACKISGCFFGPGVLTDTSLYSVYDLSIINNVYVPHRVKSNDSVLMVEDMSVTSSQIKTLSGNSGNLPNAAATTLFAIPALPRGVYRVAAYLIAGIGTPANYAASAEIHWDGAAGRITANNGAQVVLTLAGANVQVTQTSGGAQPLGVNWSALVQYLA